MPNNNTTTIFNAATGETVVRDMNEIELEIQSKIIADTKAQETAKADKATAKQAVLAKLGLTADEVAALLS